MKFHGIEMKGKFKVESKTSGYYTHTGSEDEGRLYRTGSLLVAGDATGAADAAGATVAAGAADAIFLFSVSGFI